MNEDTLNACYSHGYAILKARSKQIEDAMRSAIDTTAKIISTNPKLIDSIQKAIQILEEPEPKSEPSPYTTKFVQMIHKRMQYNFKLDMVYYSICSDGFRI